MHPVAETILEEVRRDGAMRFRRFMELALYHAEHGYYTGRRDPFGRSGDFYTAEQMQPVFGILVAALLRTLQEEAGENFAVVEIGAGRAEMRPYLEPFGYTAVDVGRGALPPRMDGVVFANEFFDALPVDLCVMRGGEWRMRDVAWDGERFVWRDGARVSPRAAEYLERWGPTETEDGTLAEVNLAALDWLQRIGERLHGWLLAIDYGYTRRELVHFPQGTLMTYRAHRADEDVLASPGERDITAHVNFTALEQYALQNGFTSVRLKRWRRR